jgi:hypothetical protein
MIHFVFSRIACIMTEKLLLTGAAEPVNEGVKDNRRDEAFQQAEPA